MQAIIDGLALRLSDLVTIQRAENQICEAAHAAIRREEVLETGNVVLTNELSIACEPFSPVGLAVALEKSGNLHQDRSEFFFRIAHAQPNGMRLSCGALKKK